MTTPIPHDYLKFRHVAHDFRQHIDTPGTILMIAGRYHVVSTGFYLHLAKPANSNHTWRPAHDDRT